MAKIGEKSLPKYQPIPKTIRVIIDKTTHLQSDQSVWWNRVGDFQIELAFRKLILGLPKLEDFNIDGRMGGILNCDQNPGKKVIVQYGVLLGLRKFCANFIWEVWAKSSL